MTWRAMYAGLTCAIWLINFCAAREIRRVLRGAVEGKDITGQGE
jgi:hypothetical protein